jgi:hypothetical protein
LQQCARKKRERRYFTYTCKCGRFSGLIMECSKAPSTPKLKPTQVRLIKMTGWLKGTTQVAELQVNRNFYLVAIN